MRPILAAAVLVAGCAEAARPPPPPYAAAAEPLIKPAKELPVKAAGVERSVELVALAVGDAKSVRVWDLPPRSLYPGSFYGLLSVECTYDDLPDRKSRVCRPRSAPLDPAEQRWIDRLKSCFRMSPTTVPVGAEPPSDPRSFLHLLTKETSLVDDPAQAGEPPGKRKRVPRTKIWHSLVAPNGMKWEYAQLGDGHEVLAPRATSIIFFAPRYLSRSGTAQIDPRFVFDRTAPGAEPKALWERLGAIASPSDDPLVFAAVAIDRAYVAVQLGDRGHLREALDDLSTLHLMDPLQGGEAEVGGIRRRAIDEVDRAAEELDAILRGDILLQDPCTQPPVEPRP